MKQIDHKVQNGKLLHVDADIRGGIIYDIRLTGDFFVHPESALARIENILKGERIENAQSVLEFFIAKKSIQLVGFCPLDVSDALKTMEKK